MIAILSSIWKPELLSAVEYASFERGEEIIGPNGATRLDEIVLVPDVPLVLIATSLGSVIVGYDTRVLTMTKLVQAATLSAHMALPTVHGKLASVVCVRRRRAAAWRVFCSPRDLFYCGPCGIAVEDDHAYQAS